MFRMFRKPHLYTLCSSIHFPCILAFSGGAGGVFPRFTILQDGLYGICMKLPCADVEADVDAVEIVVEEEEVGTVMCTVSTVLNNRTDHNDICVKVPCTDEKADVDAVETAE